LAVFLFTRASNMGTTLKKKMILKYGTLLHYEREREREREREISYKIYEV
jgi:hypothetical protein